MEKTTIGIAGWPLVAQVSVLMGYVMCGIDCILDHFNCTNIIFYILFFIIVNKIILLPFSIKTAYSSHLKKIANKEYSEIKSKYKNKEAKEYNLKSQIERYAINIKYSISQNGCLLSIIRILIVIGLYAVLRNLELYVPRINALPDDAIANIYTFFGIYLKDKPSFKQPVTMLFPLFAAFISFILEKIKLSKNNNMKNIPTGKINLYLSCIISFIISCQFSMFIAIYLSAQNIITYFVNWIIKKALSQKDDSYYIKKSLNKFNKGRQKRGLEPLNEVPTIRKENLL